MKTLLVLSCKGGVGKTTIATALARALSEKRKVGLLDLDITNPCVRTISGTKDLDIEISDTVKPAEKGNLKVMSTSFILPDENTAIMWKGERRRRMIFQYLKRVEWGDISYLIVDMPPGTGDEPLAVIEFLGTVDGAVIVSTPQNVSLTNVRKTITMCRKLGITIIGLIENMSGLKCPSCKTVINVFKSGNGSKLCDEFGIEFLGAIPLDPKISSEADDGRVGTLVVGNYFNDILHKVLGFFGESIVKAVPVEDDLTLAKLEKEPEIKYG